MKLIYKILPISILVLMFSGCSEFLEDEIQYNEEEFILESRARSRGLIDDIYTDYQFEYFNDFSIEYLTDNGVLSDEETELATGYWGPTSNPFNNVWQQSYNNIRQIYQYIDLVHDEGLPFLIDPERSDENETILARYYGEAHFLKAWSEWELLKIFGGPSSEGEMLGFPIVNGILENEEYSKISRNTYDECVAQINKDLDVAIANLPLVYDGNAALDPGTTSLETGRASGLAAYALKAKLALFAASPAFNPTNENSKWVIAAERCRDFIEQNGGLKALQDFDVSDGDNPDHIWRMRSTFNSRDLELRLYPTTMYGDGEVNPSQNLVDAFPDANGYPIDNLNSTYDPSNPYSSRDDRFYKFIFYNNDQCFTSESCTEFSPLEIYQGGQDNFGGFIKYKGTRTGYYLKKFLNNLNFDPAAVSATTNTEKVYVQLGVREMYLSYAEALNEAYGQPNTIPANFTFSAKSALERVRVKAGLAIDSDPYLDIAAADKDVFKELVKNERRIELCFTGERFHDLRRWKEINEIDENLEGVKIIKNEDDSFSYENIDVEVRNYEAKNYYLPLPYNELLINNNLKQNNGW